MRSAVILAGGMGRRIGMEKAFIEFSGKSLIERTLKTLRPVVDELVVVARDPDQSRRLEAILDDASITCDLIPGQGPVAGIQAGLLKASGKYAFACGCDLPFLNARVVEMLFEKAEGYHAAVPRKDGYAERLHAVYNRAKMEEASRCALDEGERRISAPLSRLNVNYVDSEALRSLDRELLTFFNLNTAEDLRMAQAISIGGPSIAGRRHTPPGRRARAVPGTIGGPIERPL